MDYEFLLPFSIGGGGHKLDLSLGIALPSAGDSKRIKATGNYQSRELPMVTSCLHSDTLDLPNFVVQYHKILDRVRTWVLQVDCSNASAHKKLLPAWPAAYPFLFPSPEVLNNSLSSFPSRHPKTSPSELICQQ